jgi:signal peptidase
MQLGVLRTDLINEIIRIKLWALRMLDRVGSLVSMFGLWWGDIVAGWALLIYMVIQFILPGAVSADLYLYVIQPLLWSSLALLGYLGWRYGLRVRPALNRRLLGMAFLFAICQVAILVLVGLLGGFGRSPYSHHMPAILGNLLYVGTMLLGMEISRAYLMGLLGRRIPLLALLIITILYTVLSLPLGILLQLGSPQSAIQTIGERILPVLSENLFATFLVFVAGPLASIAYLGTQLAFEWLSPVLPKVSWYVTAVMGTLIPAFGLLFFYNQTVPESVREADTRQRKGQSPVAWAVVLVISLALLGFNTGLFGVRPTLIASGSMSPSMLVGDVAITRQVTPEQVVVGDVIRYRDGSYYTIHRVVEIQNEVGEITFITRGDTNESNDPPVPGRDLEGKVILTVPKIGWVSIGIREIIGLIQ